MTSLPTATGRNAGAARLWLSFIVIIATFVLSNIVSIYEMVKIQRDVRLITKSAAVNIESLARLQHNLERKRLMVEDQSSRNK
jgi:hypothetical protein